MDVRYIREGNRSYMIMTASSVPDSDYRIPMLLQNRIPGILPVHMQVMDGVRELYYEITSYESLTRRYEAEKMAKEEILHLLLAMSHIMDEADRYLLRGTGIVLEPEYVFIGTDCREISFCYDPEGCGSMAEGLNRMARFILDHIDYDEKESVRIAYALFQESMRENITIRDFLKTAADQEHEGIEEECGDILAEAGEEESGRYRMAEPDDREPAQEEERQVQKVPLPVRRRGVLLGLEFLALGCINACIVSGLTWGIWLASELLVPEACLAGIGIAGAFAAAGVTEGIRYLIWKN